MIEMEALKKEDLNQLEGVMEGSLAGGGGAVWARFEGCSRVVKWMHDGISDRGTSVYEAERGKIA